MPKTKFIRVVEITNEADRKRANIHVLDIVLAELKGRAEQGNGQGPVEYDYILGQTIRQYKPSPKNWHNTKEAIDLWKDITDDDIHFYDYKQNINFKIDKGIETFKGTNRKSSITKPYNVGDKVPFNEIFIAEHTIPVSDIRNALINVYDSSAPSEDNRHAVSDILEKIHITRMRKTEDRKLTKSSNRVSADDIINLDSEALFDNAAKAASDSGYPLLYYSNLIDS